MKYLVSKKAILVFPDGRQVELAPGVHDVEDDVAAHWSFSAYAEPLEAKETGNAKKQSSSNK